MTLLNADDRDLNRMVSLKKLAPYRTDRSLKLTWRQLEDLKRDRHRQRQADRSIKQTTGSQPQSTSRRNQRKEMPQADSWTRPDRSACEQIEPTNTIRKVAELDVNQEDFPKAKKRRRQKKKANVQGDSC